MAANSKLNICKIAAILTHTALEWALIALLLFNGLLSYFIAKFSSFFGLSPPCVFCSRFDRALDPQISLRDLLCDAHKAEVSGLGYCSRHGNLAPASDMCEGCSPSDADRSVAVLSWMERSEAGEKDLKCSCCGVSLESQFFSPFLALKPSSGVLEITHKGDLMEFSSEAEIEEEPAEGERKAAAFVPEQDEDEVIHISSIDTIVVAIEDSPIDEGRVIPLELMDSIGLMENLVVDQQKSMELVASSASIVEITNRGSPRILEVVDIVEDHSLVHPTKVSIEDFSDEHESVVVEAIPAAISSVVAEDPNEVQASEDENKAMDGEANCEISIGSEICDQEQIGPPNFHETGSVPVNPELQSSQNCSKVINKDQAYVIYPIEVIERGVSLSRDLNEAEEERTPETPTSIEGIHALNRRFYIDRRESGTESLDGSIASEIDGYESLTIDNLKSALRSEQKALRAIYAELEEERSASAIAANQTMAMITRLHEEKAAMQMEALHYQRMMEEQSEYDQEALQLLNELMSKREKEKQELEKELEVYREKVHLYECKERRKFETSSASSRAEDSDDLSFDSHYSNQNNMVESALSYGEFEEERISILQQLKALEERLFTMDREDHFTEENGFGVNGDSEPSSHDGDGLVNGSVDGMDSNGKPHFGRRNTSFRGKSLLPLFNAISLNEEQRLDDASLKFDSKLTIDNDKFAIAKKVDNMYEKLQALEADREFIKHCILSLKRGDKGIDLLQEILHHLRGLKSVELRAS